MIFNKWAILWLVAFCLCVGMPAHAAMTRVGNTVGLKDLRITASLEENMKAAGVPSQCRKEAHQLLGKYIVYGYHDAKDALASVDILCNFTPIAQATDHGLDGMGGRKLGVLGNDGGLNYIHFRNKSGKDVERYIYRRNGTDTMECTRDKQCIRLNDGGRATIVDTTNGPIHQIPASQLPEDYYKIEARADPIGRGGMFGTVATADMPLLRKIIKVSTPGVVQGGGRVTSGFHDTRTGCTVCSHDHHGVDIAAAMGTNILAYADGQVVRALSPSQSGGGGNVCTIRHADGSYTQYFHMESLASCQQGAIVKAGQVIGQVGMTGNTTGPHVHFERFTADANMSKGSRQYMDPLNMTPPSGNVVPMSSGEVGALAEQMKASDVDMDEVESSGGAASSQIKASDYCSSSTSAGQKIIDCETLEPIGGN